MRLCEQFISKQELVVKEFTMSGGYDKAVSEEDQVSLKWDVA